MSRRLLTAPAKKPHSGFFSDFADLKPAILSFTWTTASANSKACAKSKPTAAAANSCSFVTQKMRAFTFRSSAWTSCKVTEC